MRLEEFVSLGLLQEINRQFLHPMGLALSVKIEEDGSMEFAEIWDYRNDPEGLIFDESVTADPEFKRKINTVKELIESKKKHREENLGFYIQNE